MALPPVGYDLIRLAGGLDLVTPTLSLQPGAVRRAANFEASLNGGYTRIAGYERHSGKANPSDALYELLTATLTGALSVGNTVTGNTSAATGEVIAVENGSVAVTKKTGTFQTGELLRVGATTVGTLTGIVGASADGETDSRYRHLAANVYRADIAAVPGSGPIRGVAYFKDIVYAWRNNTAGTALVMHKATTSGWAAVTTPALAAGGRVTTVNANFGGGPQNFKMYGADGKNKAFVFDGTTYTQITTGMSPDTPSLVAVHKQHLFLSFDYSLQFSAIGNPLSWTPVLGAGEISMNGTITNLLPLPGDQTSGALGVYTRQDTSILYGASSADFKLSVFNTGTGAYAHTAQTMDQAYVFDDRGVMGLGTSLNFGNFVTASLTAKILPFVQARRNLAVASTVNREKGQYRVFFSDGKALYLTIVNGQLLGIMPMEFNHAVTCCVEGELPDGKGVTYFGSENGFVYRLDAGTSFDGEPIPANINMVFNSIKSPRIYKRYRKASIELTGDSFAQIVFGYDLGYRTKNRDQSVDTVHDNDLRSSYWDEMQWDLFVWDGSEITPSEIDITGSAENLGIRISCVSEILQPFTVNSVIVHYTMRRGIR